MILVNSILFFPAMFTCLVQAQDKQQVRFHQEEMYTRDIVKDLESKWK